MPPFLGQAVLRQPANETPKQLALLGDTLGRALEQRRDLKTKHEIGQAYQQGGLPSAQQAAFRSGRPDLGMQFTNTIEQQKARAAQQQHQQAALALQQKALAGQQAYQQGMLGIAQGGEQRSQGAYDRQVAAADAFKKSMGIGVPPQQQPGAGQPPPPQGNPYFSAPAAQGGVFGYQAPAPIGASPAAQPQQQGVQMPENIKAEIVATASSGKASDLAKASKMKREWTDGARRENMTVNVGRENLSLLNSDIATLLTPASLSHLVGKSGAIKNWMQKDDGLTGAMALSPEARNAFGALESLRGKMGFQKLAEIRAASKTGGGVGSLAVKELELMINSFKAIKPGMSKEALVDNLNSIGRRAAVIDGEIYKGHISKYGAGSVPPPKQWVDIKVGKSGRATKTGVKWGFN